MTESSQKIEKCQLQACLHVGAFFIFWLFERLVYSRTSGLSLNRICRDHVNVDFSFTQHLHGLDRTIYLLNCKI